MPLVSEAGRLREIYGTYINCVLKGWFLLHHFRGCISKAFLSSTDSGWQLRLFLIVLLSLKVFPPILLKANNFFLGRLNKFIWLTIVTPTLLCLAN